MSKLKSRAAAVVMCCAGWVYACGGSSFSATGTSNGGAAGASAGADVGGNSTVGGDASGGSAEAGAASGGEAGVAEAGAAQGGGSQAGSSSAGAGGNAAGAAGTAGAGTVRNSGDCSIDKDCGSGDTCVALSPSGFRTCVAPVAPPSNCTASDACCPGLKDCATGMECVESPLAPSCGLETRPAPICTKDACSTLADCSGNNAICAPAGALERKINTCLTGGCRRDGDCKDATGGKCEPVTSNCCSAPDGLYCVYPGTGCRTSADCAVGSTCQVVNQKNGECVVGAGVCPA